MPVYNECRWIAEIVRRVLAVPIQKELIIVDDGSTDGTQSFLAELNDPLILVIFQRVNRGKGAAIQEAFKYVTGDIVIIQDADLEYDPIDYPRLIMPIIENKADIVFGSRFLGNSHRVLYYWHYVANKVLTTLSNMLTNLNLTDMEAGYKAFRREVVDTITLRSKRFGFEPEFTAKVAHKCNPPWRIYEVPISYSGRTYEEGKKIGFKDAISAFYCILRFGLFG